MADSETDPKISPISGDVFGKRNVEYTVEISDQPGYVKLIRPLRKTGRAAEAKSE